MKQYRAHDKSTVSHSEELKHIRSINWYSLISGDTALMMAKNIESLFALAETNPSTETAVTGKGKQKGRGRGSGSTRKGKGFNPQNYCTAWAKKAAEWATIYRTQLGKLEGKDSWCIKFKWGWEWEWGE